MGGFGNHRSACLQLYGSGVNYYRWPYTHRRKFCGSNCYLKSFQADLHFMGESKNEEPHKKDSLAPKSSTYHPSHLRVRRSTSTSPVMKFSLVFIKNRHNINYTSTRLI